MFISFTDLLFKISLLDKLLFSDILSFDLGILILEELCFLIPAFWVFLMVLKRLVLFSLFSILFDFLLFLFIVIVSFFSFTLITSSRFSLLKTLLFLLYTQILLLSISELFLLD